MKGGSWQRGHWALSINDCRRSWSTDAGVVTGSGGEAHQIFLDGKAVAAARGVRTRVGAIRGEDAGLTRVGEVGSEDFFADTFAEDGILQRENYFDTLVKIAGHPVRTAEKHFRRAAIFEIIDAAVFEKTADDAAH